MVWQVFFRPRPEPPWANDLKLMLAQSYQRMGKLMSIVQDIKDKLAKVQAGVTQNTSLDQSIIQMMQGQGATILDLQQKLNDAIAAGGDVQALQEVSDGLGAVATSLTAEAQAKSDAITANTPVDTGGGGSGSAPVPPTA